MEHAQRIDRTFSWRGGVLAVVLLLVIALAGLGGMALLHGIGGSTPAARAQQTPRHTAVRLHPRSDISVLVLNGNGVNGAAGDVATRLLGRGYAHAIATDAPNHDYARSLVLFRRGFAGEANRLAKDAHIGAVAPLDGRLPSAYARDQLIVILGR